MTPSYLHKSRIFVHHPLNISFPCILYPSVSVCIWVWVWTAKWQFGHTQVIQITIWSFSLKNIQIFYFEMSSQIAIQLFSIKKVRKFLNSQMAIRPYRSHSAVHTQTQIQTESEAFKTHSYAPALSRPGKKTWCYSHVWKSREWWWTCRSCRWVWQGWRRAPSPTPPPHPTSDTCNQGTLSGCMSPRGRWTRPENILVVKYSRCSYRWYLRTWDWVWDIWPRLRNRYS